ncbi:MAG: 2-dehydropantoate 2-reductase [Phycisphaerales bacterium]|nr:MAG: 2-dehydropantoate 2-reductase [Phycisphaerales bacterium]
MRVLIYGGGAVGLGIASCLLKSGAEVDVLAREETVGLLRKEGLIRRGIFGEYRAGPGAFGCYTSLDEVERGQYDYALVCTKSFDSHEAAGDLWEHGDLLGGRTMIVLFQNGWGNAEEFVPFFGDERVYNARVITGFHRHAANHVKVTVHADSIHVGSLFGHAASRVEELCLSIDEGDIPCGTTGEIGKDLWAKMLYNCALNPLGAILGVRYGVLAEGVWTRRIMDVIVEEVFGVMGAAGYSTHWRSGGEFLRVFYEKLIPDTAEHESSMLQDIAAKKRTEIDALNGAVVALGGKHSVGVPCNMTIYNLVKSMEAGNL